MQTVLKAHTLSQCLDSMAEYAQAFEKQGGENLIFCEDRLTLLAERALTRKMDGTLFSSVTTFARMIKTEQKTISKQGSVMAVGEVMAGLQRKNALQCFKTAAGIGNNAKCIYETLAQFASSCITPQTLRESMEQLTDVALKRKIADLALIYEGYEEFLQTNGYLDESRYLALLPARMREEYDLSDVNVFFLGFSSFTLQALGVVRAALENAKNVVGIFCAGEEDIYTSRAANAFIDVCKEYGKTNVLNVGKPLNGAAETLRKSLFNPEFYLGSKQKTGAIRIFEAEDKVAECEYVAVQIKRAMQTDEQLRYRDFAVLLPDVNAYSLPIKRALTEYKIPYFLDEKRSLGRHPLGLFILECLRVVKERFSPISVQSLTQNVFFGESDEYRNYLLKYANYRGGAKREIKSGELIEKAYDVAALQWGRERLLKATEHIKNKASGAAYVAAVRKLLIDFKAEETLSNLQESLEDLAQKGYLSQIYRALEQVLEEAELLIGGKELSVAEFTAILQDGLDATEISLIPLKADAVFIGDITDSRIDTMQVVFALGLSEDVPRAATDTAIVSDKEIARLAQVKARLEPTVAEVNLRSRESVSLNLCAFEKELHITYPLSLDGSEPSPSEIFRYVDSAFCDENGECLPRRKAYLKQEFAYRCSALTPAIRQLLSEKNAYEQKGVDTRKQYSSLFTALDKLSITEKDDYLVERGGHVRVERGEELFFRNGKISPTAMEGYFSCPFRNFVERGLKLKDREETAVLAVDTGNFIHEVLEKTAKYTSQVQSEEEMYTLALRIGEEILKSPVYSSQADTASGAFFAEKLLKEGADVAVAAYQQIAGSSFVVEETEKSVTTDTFRGKIDRVDGTEQYVRIVDYKTGSIDDSALSYYTGRKMQMQLYMSAIKGERIPAGVFYFPASVDYTDTSEGKFQMKGFLNGDSDALLCGDKSLTEDKQSEFFPASLKNTHSKRVMDESTFRDFLDYSVFVSRQAQEELKDGFIAPTPYAASCDFCKYGGMCGFNRDVCSARQEQSIDAAAIAEIARKKRDGEED